MSLPGVSPQRAIDRVASSAPSYSAFGSTRMICPPDEYSSLKPTVICGPRPSISVPMTERTSVRSLSSSGVPAMRRKRTT